MTDYDPEDDDLYFYDDEIDDELDDDVDELDEFDVEEDFGDDEPRPLWTRNRLLLIIVVFIIMVTFLAYTLQGLFLAPPPPPTFTPGSRI